MFYKDYWPCPFCENGMIEVVVRPATFSAKRTAVRGGRKTNLVKVKEEVAIVVEECPACHKKAKQIERMWRKQGIIG